MFKKNMDKPEVKGSFDDIPKTLVKRKPEKDFDNEYLNLYKKTQKAEVIHPEIDGSQFVELDTLV